MNSPLNAIHLTLQAFDEDLPEDDDQLRPLLGSAGRATSRCKRLVADLLAFSREPCLSANTDLQEVVKACVEIFRNESPPDMQVNASFADAPPQLTLDKAQLQQAILNLMSNASDAMGGKGTIDLTVRPADDEVILEIRDNGPGMAPEVSDRVFEPFFTTKATGRGHGLGLPITQQLVQRNGGTIDLDTALGEGTTFLLHFPVSAAAESSRGAES
jgi:signal transduction histidine kinase